MYLGLQSIAIYAVKSQGCHLFFCVKFFSTICPEYTKLRVTISRLSMQPLNNLKTLKICLYPKAWEKGTSRQ